MTPTPPSANSTLPAGPRSLEEEFRIVKKRNRVPLSCTPCRSRKWKCDRNRPCSNCVKREGRNTNSCTYATSAAREKSARNGALSPGDMQNRIGRLEDLIVTLVHGDANIESPSRASGTAVTSVATTSSTSQSMGAGQNDEVNLEDCERYGNIGCDLANSLGVLNIDLKKGKSVYIGQEHWQTILSGISEVKNYFSDHKKELENSYEKIRMSKPASAREGLTFLLGSVPAATEVELRAELPPRSTVLALCMRYFNSMDNPVVIIHSPAFHQQLQAHWQNPSKTPIMWLGLLYSILCLAMQSYHNIGDVPLEWQGRTLELAAEYRMRTVQCLVTADYTKPVEHTVETMLLYVFGEYSSRWDADHGLWLVVSLVTRIAFQMGYHRDGKWFASLTPFQAEMRRRTWALLRMADVMFSHQVSLPNMIYSRNCDTEPPTNLFDEEFGLESKSLPPPRPKNELTKTAYMISKVKLCVVMSDILQETNRVDGKVTYDDILAFDTRLRTIYEELPSHLKGAPLGGSQDSAMVILTRFSINSLYLNILCLLHKKYVPQARKVARYAYSRRSAINAASETLRHLITLHHEVQPNGRLQSLQWYLNSMATKEFLVCAMLVALDLHHDRMAEISNDKDFSETALFWTSEQQIEMMNNLEMTKNFWKGLADDSTEAFQASKVLEIMLNKIKSPVQTPETTGSAGTTSFSSFNHYPKYEPDYSAATAMTRPSKGMALDIGASIDSLPASALDVMNSSNPISGLSITPNLAGGDYANMNSAPSPFSMLASLEAGGGDIAANFDWSIFENYTQTTNWGDGDGFQMYPGPQGTDEFGVPFNNDNMTG
ncbi:hypothetical protein AK830_g5550 [Neonectria ditissima]|uniref:Zn(2)-C6 fungal-type domain-containing protein n=1 Tax=Neonectria ditissima TaxID=78410 RepID=A0A0P7BE36_9HYPO|nr:hypothetical protein AK830_g5550 [Neonectria ditissima]